jgi:hypothetical protein
MDTVPTYGYYNGVVPYYGYYGSNVYVAPYRSYWSGPYYYGYREWPRTYYWRR